MGLTFRLGQLPTSLFTDASNNVGIGAAPSGSYKFEVTGTAKVSSTLLVSGNTGFGIAPASPFIINALASDSTTNSVIGVTQIGRSSTGTAANGIGGNIQFTAQDTAGTQRTAAYITWKLAAASSASPQGYLSIGSRNASEALAILDSGNVGIGTSTGNGKLIIKQSSTALFEGLNVYASTNDSFVGIGHTGSLAVINSSYNSTGNYSPLAFYTSDVERMRITSGGITQLTGANASVRLEIRNNDGASYTAFTEQEIRMYRPDGSGADFQIATQAISGTLGAGAITFAPRNVTRMSIFGSGNIRFSSQVYNNTVTSPRTLYVASDGEIGGQSSILASKTNIKHFDTNWLYDLKPVQFNYRKKNENKEYTNEFDTELYYGLIAEETELVNKELCTYKDDKLMGIEYSKLVPVLVKAIQEQNQIIQELNERLNKAGL
jgi:hypothetical protein